MLQLYVPTFSFLEQNGSSSINVAILSGNNKFCRDYMRCLVKEIIILNLVETVIKPWNVPKFHE